MKQIKLLRILHTNCRRNHSVANPSVKLSNDEVRKKRNFIFNEEMARQQSLITRVEKIEVHVDSPPDKCTLIMNKDISTPFDCGRHIGEVITKRAVLAQVNDEYWDMHRPLTADCELKFLHFKQEDPYHVNKAFWRSCSFLLGLLAERAFRNNFYVQVHSWPSPNVRRGRFICDVDLPMDWNPTQEELNVLSTTMLRICKENHRFEHLEVNKSVALRLFEDNRFKKEQIPLMKSSSQKDGSVILYRVDGHIDVSVGPMIANTNLIGKFTVAAVHHIESQDGKLFRFQGVALPEQLPISSFAYSILVKRAAKLVKLHYHSDDHTKDLKEG